VSDLVRLDARVASSPTFVLSRLIVATYLVLVCVHTIILATLIIWPISQIKVQEFGKVIQIVRTQINNIVHQA
jgi:hypothetical protein